MQRTVLAAVVATLITITGSARAATLPVFEVVPTNYVPGVPFTFELHAPGVLGLNGYSITLQFEAGPNPPPLTATATPPPGLVGYPFPDATNFLVTPVASSPPAPLQITITDHSSGSRVPLTGPSNDFLALVTVTPDASLRSDMTITVTAASFDRLGFRGEPPPPFDLPEPLVISPDLSGVTTPVPAPAAWVTFTLGGLGLAMARKRLGRATA